MAPLSGLDEEEEESDPDMDFGLFDEYIPSAPAPSQPPPPPVLHAHSSLSAASAFIPVVQRPLSHPAQSLATGFSFGSPHPASPPPPPLPPPYARRRKGRPFAIGSARHVRAPLVTNSVKKQKSPEILPDGLCPESEPLELGRSKLLRGRKSRQSRTAPSSSSMLDFGYCAEVPPQGGSVFSEEYSERSMELSSYTSSVVSSASTKRKKKRFSVLFSVSSPEGPHPLSPLQQAFESADPAVAELRWTEVFKMQHSEGYWELTTELGEFINVDVDLFANVFLKSKGIHSLGVRACADILRLLATLLVLQLMRVEKLEEGKLLRTLFCLEDTAEPRPKWWGEVRRAVDWVCWADWQYPCVYSRLEFGLSWESSTRQLLGYEGLSSFSPLSGLNLRRTAAPVLVH